MKQEMLINVAQPEECRIAVVEDGQLEELYVERFLQHGRGRELADLDGAHLLLQCAAVLLCCTVLCCYRTVLHRNNTG